MSNPIETLVFCDNPACPLHEKKLSLATWRAVGVDLPSVEEAKKQPVACHECNDHNRQGLLIYVPMEHFAAVGARRQSGEEWTQVPREENSAVPSIEEGVLSHDLELTDRDGAPVGVALNIIPYGGYILRYQDRDDLVLYGPRQDNLPNQDPPQPNYIAQLQDDLIFLCYWNTLRAEPKSIVKPTKGVFHYSMMGSTLALKEDLSTFYGIPTTTDISATKISLDTGSKLALDGLNIPIYYDRDLHNPVLELFSEILDPIRSAREVALAVAKGWSQITKKIGKDGKVPKQYRKKLKNLLSDSSEAKATCDEAVSLESQLAPNRTSLSSVSKLLDDPVFEYDIPTGGKKKNWKAFANVATQWEEALSNQGQGPIQDCLTSLTDFVPAEDEDPTVAQSYQDLRSVYGDLATTLDAAVVMGWEVLGGLPTTYAAYQTKIRSFSCVDWATAAYLHAMRYGIPIGGSGAIKRAGGLLAFRLPDEGVDVGLNHTPEELYPMAIHLAENKKVPPAFVLERFGGESGFEQTYTLKTIWAFKAHRRVKLPKMGTDYANWCPEGGTKSTFCFSELFCRGPRDWQRGGGRGYSGPIMMSRGWGISQATRGTFVKGVTKKGRDSTSDDMQWILGLPVPPDNTQVVIPQFIGSTTDAVENGVQILRNKFDKSSVKKRDCSYATNVGGKKHDCHSCLQRFDVKKDFAYIKDKHTYALDVEPERFEELTEVTYPTDSTELLEWPCSWLTAVMRYGGTGLRTFERLQKTAKIIADPSGDLAKYVILNDP